MSALEQHFSMIDPDADPPKEDVVASLLGVIGYSAQSLEMHPNWLGKIIKHMRSESLRIKRKL